MAHGSRVRFYSVFFLSMCSPKRAKKTHDQGKCIKYSFMQSLESTYKMARKFMYVVRSLVHTLIFVLLCCWLIHSSLWRCHTGCASTGILYCQCPSLAWQAKITFGSLFVIHSLAQLSFARQKSKCVSISRKIIFRAWIVCNTCKLQWPEKCFWQSWQNYFICLQLELTVFSPVQYTHWMCSSRKRAWSGWQLLGWLAVHILTLNRCNAQPKHVYIYEFVCVYRKWECNHGKSISM